MKLNDYMQDGANKQARAVLCYLQDFNAEDSWNDTTKQYDARIEVDRWQNCREQGYILTMEGLCIAFFEHRNSDSICALRWEQSAFPNPPTIDTADFKGACYKDKWDVSHQVGFGMAQEMAQWIEEQLTKWWTNKMEVTK